MADRYITGYLSLSQAEFDFNGIMTHFQRAGYTLRHPHTDDIRGFTNEGEPITYTEGSLAEALRSNRLVGFSLWRNESEDIFCTLRFIANCTVVSFDLSGTLPDEQLAVLASAMAYFTELSFARLLLGFYADFEDSIENPHAMDRLFLRCK